MSARRLVTFIVGFLLIAHLVLAGFYPVSSEDTWWHLKQGELYVTTHSLPTQDPFAFTTQGRPWMKYSWIADVLFYLIFDVTGLPGLVLFRLLMLLVIAFTLYRLLRSCGLHPLASVFVVFVVSLAVRFRLLIRPEILSFLILLIFMAILLRLRTEAPLFAYSLLPVQVVWTNVHGSFIFGFWLAGLILLVNWLPTSRSVPGWSRLEFDRGRMKHLAATVACLPLVSLLNPNGASLLLFPIRQNSMTRLTEFGDWMEVWRLPEAFGALWWRPTIILGLLVLGFAVSAALLAAWEGQFDPVGWGIVLSMGTYAVFRNRAIPYFALAVTPVLALAIVRLGERARARTPGWSGAWMERIGAGGCLLILSASIVMRSFPTPPFQLGFGPPPNFFPEGAAAFLERNHLDGRIFNTYIYGGYLIWRRWPANQVFIDGRYDGILFDESVLEAYHEALRSPAALSRITKAYDLDILLLNTHVANRPPYLDENEEWARVYWDPMTEVFLRRGGRYASFVAGHEYRLTGPALDTGYLTAYRRDAQTWSRALKELRRAVEDNPQNRMAWLSLAQEYRAVGSEAQEQRLEALTHAASLMANSAAIGRVEAERAEALLELGRLDEATRAAEKALRLDGELPLPRWVLASIAEHRGAWREAREQLRGLLALLKPDDPRIQMVRARFNAVEERLRTQGVR